ncbi:MAG: putative hydro-lyase [Lachnospiraceae bacterium]|nr:putative hydro-lyase [Lachnospiraceae bacterium]
MENIKEIPELYAEKNKASDYADFLPREVRQLIRMGSITGQTSGMCSGYAQANLVVLPKKDAFDFLLFATKNPKSCPLLEVTDAGSKYLTDIAPGADITKDIPKYRIYEKGELVGEFTDVSDYWRTDLVSFLIGCSFSFESEMLNAEIPVRQIEMNCNVPMYKTNIKCKSAGIFHGNMVVSMRPIPHELIPKAVLVTGAMPKVHGAPVHIGFPEAIGIEDLAHPDFGDPVIINEGEVPVFWPCGVTPQSVVMASKPDFCITHSPGHMFISDVKNVNLKY